MWQTVIHLWIVRLTQWKIKGIPRNLTVRKWQNENDDNLMVLSASIPAKWLIIHIPRPEEGTWEKRAVCLMHYMQNCWMSNSQCPLSHLSYNSEVFHSVHTTQEFSMGSVCWAPIIRLIGRLRRDLIGRSVSVKCVVYTWTEDSLINCTVKRFVRVQSTRMTDTKAASGRTLKGMWPGHQHIQFR